MGHQAELHNVAQAEDEWPEITITITSRSLGAGKSTLSALVANALENAGLSKISIREGEPHSPGYELQYQKAMEELRSYFREHGTDEVHDRRIVIVERTI